MNDDFSLKTTIVEGDNFQLQEDMLDENNVYLTLENVEFKVECMRFSETDKTTSISVKIPIEIWAVIRKYAEPDIQYAGWWDSDIVEFATKEVTERVKSYKIAVEQEGEAIASLKYLYGSVVYGAVTDPQEDQIAATVEYIKKMRDAQDKIQNAIANAKANMQ